MASSMLTGMWRICPSRRIVAHVLDDEDAALGATRFFLEGGGTLRRGSAQHGRRPATITPSRKLGSVPRHVRFLYHACSQWCPSTSIRAVFARYPSAHHVCKATHERTHRPSTKFSLGILVPQSSARDAGRGRNPWWPPTALRIRTAQAGQAKVRLHRVIQSDT